VRSRCRWRRGRWHRRRVVDRIVDSVGSESSPPECPLDGACRPRNGPACWPRHPWTWLSERGEGQAGRFPTKFLRRYALTQVQGRSTYVRVYRRKLMSQGIAQRPGHCLCVGQGEESLSRQGRGAPRDGPDSRFTSLREKTIRPSISSRVIQRKRGRDVRKVGSHH
jgi:hypothetical protein